MKLTKSPDEIRADYLRTIKNGLIGIGIEQPNVAEGSDYYIAGTAIANQISVLFNNIEVSADELMPDTATGESLDRLLAVYGLARRPAASSSGQVQIVTSAPTLVADGTELVSATGVVIKVTYGGIFSNNDIIDVTSVDAGSKTNIAAGAILTWVGTPAFTQSTTVVTRALSGGVDAEDDETARARLLSRLANPPGSGNWQQVAEIAESSDSVVQKAFVYPAANGPSTLHIAVAGYPSSVSKSRQIDSNKLNSTISPVIKGSLPEYVETVITTVQDVPTDVSIALSIPLSQAGYSQVSGPGTGVGWLDATPFPATNSSTHYFCPITAVASSTQFTVSAPSGPIVGVSKINWIDKTSWTVKQAKVIASTTLTSTTFQITVDTPLVGIAVDDWIFPASLNAQSYLDAVVSGFALMGPGEKTLYVARAARQPQPSQTFPSVLDSSMLKYVINAGNEVSNAAFLYRGTTTPAFQHTSIPTVPGVPSSITSPPKILIPRNIGFYPI